MLGTTMTLKVLVELKCGLIKSKGLLFVTTVVKVLVERDWFRAEVQVMTPLPLMAAPAGATSN